MINQPKYKVFVRTWWKLNKDWPNGLESHMGTKKTIRKGLSEDEAIKIATNWNNSHNPGKLSRKAEVTTM